MATSFLNAMKKTNDATTAGAVVPAKKPNPLLKKANPLTVGKAEDAKKEETAAPVAKKPSPLLKKKVEEKEETLSVKDKAIEEAKAEIVNDAKKEVLEEQQEAPIVEEKVVEAKEEVVTPVKVKTVKEEPAPKKSRTQTKNAKKKTPIVEEKDIDPTVEVHKTCIDYADALTAVMSSFVDEEWEAFKQELAEELAEIEISSDMNAATMKQAIAQLSTLRQKVWFDYQATKSNFESLSNKEPEGIIERVKKVNLGDGTNDLQRKKAGVEACMNYVPQGSTEVINLYEVLDETRTRFNFLRNVIDSVEYKTKVLITMSSALKLEGQHIGAEV